MSCGVPAVTSNIGGLPELMVDGETGYICDLDDLDSFVARSYEILTDDELQARMAAASRQRAVEQFDINQIVPQYEAYYRHVLESRHVATP